MCLVFVQAHIYDWEESQTSPDNKVTPESHFWNTQQTQLGVEAVLTNTWAHCRCAKVNAQKFMSNAVLRTTTPNVPRWGIVSYPLWVHKMNFL